MTFFILQHSCKIILFILRNFEKYLFTIYNIIFYDYTSKFISIFSELRMYPFLEPLDINIFDDENLDDLNAEYFESFCEEYLMDEPLENQNEKHDICKKLVRNFVHLSTKGRETGHYDCVCLTTWLYNKTVSSNIPFDFIRGMYLDLVNKPHIFSNVGSCDYDQFEIIKNDPDKIRKFFYFTISDEKIKAAISLGKNYPYREALIEYVNECVKVYETYINKCSTKKFNDILCDELHNFDEVYEDIKTKLSESDYQIYSLQSTPDEGIQKFSLKVEENALPPRDSDVPADGGIAPGGMSTSKIVTMGSLISVPAVSFYVFKVKKRIF
ncbi:hypothetical protein PVBG_01354 [Plasmodium vivax Brazil I]|uniref:Uncharacterized protein n=1 Tax=Plasmodium vivax (strain Brazil I) TaxID=1033975 RepID=A0A0J9SSI1_PLAV1|nr:hypothetical protein PVBG_01354 [Plasmodium vivax Brazil I]